MDNNLDISKLNTIEANKKFINLVWFIAIIASIIVLRSGIVGDLSIIATAGFIIVTAALIAVSTVAYRKDKSTLLMRNMFAVIWGIGIILLIATGKSQMILFALMYVTVFSLYIDRKFLIIIVSIMTVASTIKSGTIVAGGSFGIIDFMIIISLYVGESIAILNAVFLNKNSRKINEAVKRIEQDKDEKEETNEKIVHTIDKIINNSDIIYNIVNDISDTTVAVASAIEDISKGASTTTSHINAQSHQSEEIQRKIKESVKSCDTLSKKCKDTSKVTDSGVNIVNMLSKESKVVTTNTKEVSRLMEELNDKSNAISNISDVISDIAEQTNLLALNASIEAARAGEMGKGFIVVAEEVGKLADQCKTSAEDISNIIQELVDKTVLSNKKVDELLTSNSRQNELVENTRNIFGDINSNVNEIGVENSEVKKSIDEVLEANDIILKSILNISSISEQTMANTEETYAMSNEHINKAKEALKLVEELKTATSELDYRK